MEPIKVYRNRDGGDFGTTREGPHDEEFVVTTRADFDALAADAADARTLRAERDSLVKERDEGRTEIELMAMAGEMMNRQLAAATARADKAEALLREARVAVDLWTDDHRCGEDVSLKPDYAADLRARIDAHLERKA